MNKLSSILEIGKQKKVEREIAEEKERKRKAEEEEAKK